MAYQQGSFPIVEKKQLTEDVFSFLVRCPEVAAQSEAGQFVHIKVEGFSLRRPISICEVDRDAGTLRLVMQVRGKGTDAIAAQKEGDLLDLLAPLGHGFRIPEEGRILVVGGGIGVPPLLQAAKESRGADAVLGFRSAGQVILAEDYAAVCGDVQIATDDGSLGRKGTVVPIVAEKLAAERYAAVLACGPTRMLEAVATAAREAGVPCQVSMEERMGCGIGACLVCACKTRKADGSEDFSHVCKDGPVFDAERVFFKEEGRN
ncbi:MAG: dihydroorotate dehydrogenase electron transfer subunit [Ruminococcaceae bacterium]|nr:dihydroorotate dehydrogenase electron transfer subunit [Oscillospiraceae bacterium]